MKSGKRQMMEKNRTTKSRKNQNARRKKTTYKYLGILKANSIKQAEMKKKFQKEYPRIMRKPNDKADISSKG